MLCFHISFFRQSKPLFSGANFAYKRRISNCCTVYRIRNKLAVQCGIFIILSSVGYLLNLCILYRHMRTVRYPDMIHQGSFMKYILLVLPPITFLRFSFLTSPAEISSVRARSTVVTPRLHSTDILLRDGKHLRFLPA